MKAYSLFLRVLEHVRKNGLHWTIRRSVYASGLPRLLQLPGQLIRQRSFDDDDTLYAYYDLNVDPITYDAMWFCVCAELERRDRGLKHLALILVPADGGAVREETFEYDQVVNRDKRIWRLQNIVISSMLLLKPEASVHILRHVRDLRRLSGRSRHVFPDGYSPFLFPRAFTYQDFAILQSSLAARGLEKFFTGGLAGRSFIESWRGCFGIKSRMVVITVRRYGFAPDRNSNLAAWLEFARELDREKYSVVFVPDTDSAYDNYTVEIAREFPVFREAAFHPQLRVALYESAFVNMSTLAGPASMVMLNAECRYLQFKPMVDSAPMSTRRVVEEMGFKINENPAYAAPFQKLIWEEDNVEVLRREFLAFEAQAAEFELSDIPDLRA